MNLPRRLLPLALFLAAPLAAQTPVVPDWALPGSSTHHQVPPPADFRRATTTYTVPIGVFEGQSDVGTALVPGSASFDPAAGRYTIKSAGYNIWYFRDEFRYLWKKMSGDVSLAADIDFPNPDGYGDRKVVLIIRQDLNDDAREAMVALHGAGLIHLAGRLDPHTDLRETFKVPRVSGAPLTRRLGIEKRGDNFTLYLGRHDGPLRPAGPPLILHFDAPFFVGIGFTSHQPATVDTAEVSAVVLTNDAGQVK